VNLTATNEKGIDSKLSKITVLDKGDIGGNEGGRCRGYVNISPEPAKNIEGKETSQAFVTNEKAVKFDFLMNATSPCM